SYQIIQERSKLEESESDNKFQGEAAIDNAIILIEDLLAKTNSIA
ncbi:37048_t:CDS:1, partial [Gigaspora margarita]